MMRNKLLPALKILGVVLVLFTGVRIIGILGNCSAGRCGVSGDSFDSAMKRFSRTDPKLILFREEKRIGTGLKEPRGIAIGADGRLYVVGDKTIVAFDAKGKRISRFGLDDSPYCIAAAANGRLYIGMRDHVCVYGTSGKQISRWASIGGKAYITSVSADKSAVWVADAGNRVVLKCDFAGRILGQFGKRDDSKHVLGLIVPSPHLDVVAAAGGAVWTANPGRHVLELYANDGSLKRSWGKTSFAIDGFSGCCNPTDFAILPDGRFVTSEKGIPRVKIYAANGKFVGIVAGFESFKSDVVGLDLATNSNGGIYVLDPANACVKVYCRKQAR